LGARKCSESSLAVECSDGVSTSSSPMDGHDTSASALMVGVLEPLFWQGRVATTMCTVEGFREPTPFVPDPMRMLRSSCRLTLVPSEPLAAPSLCVDLLLELCFPWKHQPWSLRKCVGDFEFAALLFEYPSAAQKVQFVGHGFQVSG
jgi:hypothetical protein